MKIKQIICPKCKKGEFEGPLNGTYNCNICGAPLTDEIINTELDKAWTEHIRSLAEVSHEQES